MNPGLLAPEIALVVSAVVVILTDLFVEKKGALAWLSLAGLVVSAGTGTVTRAVLLALDWFAAASMARTVKEYV